MSKLYNFRGGEVLLVDKPLEWTSFDVVNKLRYQLKHKTGIKRFKVGHAGTLDPLASGLLIVCCGKATKTIDSFMGMAKEYTGTIVLGATRPSYDMETEIDQEF
ncbi:MAG: tRNA pseudouridine(55) synthase, partial [Salibacteraceae bacterium]